MKFFNINLSPINRKIILVIGLGILLRMIVFFMIKPYTVQGKEKILQNDAYGYHILAIEVKNDKSFGKDDPFSSALRTPGYPVFISIIYKIFGENPWYVIISQIFLESLLIFLIFYFTTVMINEYVGLLAAFFYGIDPITIQYSNTLLSDSLFTFFIFLNYLFLYRYFENKKYSNILISGFVLGIAAYIRPIGFYLSFVNILLLILLKIYKKEKFIKSALAYLMPFIIIVLPWIFRNKMVHKHFFFSTSGNYNSLVLYASDVEAEAKNIDQNFIIKKYKEEINSKFQRITHQNIYEVHNEYKKIAMQIFKKYPSAFIKSYALGIIDMFFSINRQIWEMITNHYNNIQFDAIKLIKAEKVKGFIKCISNYNISTLIYAFYVLTWSVTTYILSLFGFLKLLEMKNILILIFISIPILYFILIVGQAGLARFKLPFMPYYLILSAVGVDYLMKREKLKLFLISNKTHQEEFEK